jgi:hypothetical protein
LWIDLFWGNYVNVIIELEKIYEFLYGAYLAAKAVNDTNSREVLHAACHKINNLLRSIDEEVKAKLDEFKPISDKFYNFKESNNEDPK